MCRRRKSFCRTADGFVERFRKLDVYGGTESMLFRITRT